MKRTMKRLANQAVHHAVKPTPPYSSHSIVQRGSWIPLGMALCLAFSASAQKSDEKKLYCWNEGGRKVCSDSLPSSAVNQQRTEINQKSGTAISQVSRALNQAEREQAALAQKAADNDAEQHRRDMAMIQSYDTELELQRAFRNRFELLDESLKSSKLARTNQHNNLLVMLRQANELELLSKPVGKGLIEKIRTQHNELKVLAALEQRQQQERASLDNEFQAALARYRDIKLAAPASTPPPSG